MGAVFSYSFSTGVGRFSTALFQSLMGAVFSYSMIAHKIGRILNGVSIPDGCSVQL